MSDLLKEKESMTFTLSNAEGKAVECELLFSFDDQVTGHHYIVYTDNIPEENGQLPVYANRYDPERKGGPLLPVEEPRIWDVIAHMLEQHTKTEEAMKSDLEDILNAMSPEEMNEALNRLNNT